MRYWNIASQGRKLDGNGRALMDKLTGQQSTNDVDCQQFVNKNISSNKIQENYEDIKTFLVATVIQLLNIFTAEKNHAAE